MKKFLFVTVLVLISTGLFALTETVTPTVTATITATATITPHAVRVNKTYNYVDTYGTAGYQIMWPKPCYLVGYEVNKTNCTDAGDTLNVYNASQFSEMIASNYSFPIGVLDCTRLPIGSPVTKLFGWSAQLPFYRYYDKGIGVSITADGVESTFYIYDK